MKAVETFNDRFFLTMGNTGAGMTPYNPIQLGLGARLILQTDRNVNDVEMTLSRVVDGDSVNPNPLNPVKTSESTWEVEGAIGGARLGFPQPAPSYHVPQCFELRVVARNRSKVDVKTYTFWVGEGLVGTIAECIDRIAIGTKPLIAGFDGLGWHEFMFADNYAEFYARNNLDPFVSNDDDCLKGLNEDINEGVYVPGNGDLWGGLTPAPDNPWARLPEPSSQPQFLYPLTPASGAYVVNAIDNTGTTPSGAVFEFATPENASGNQSFGNQDAWRWDDRAPFPVPTLTWLVSPLLTFRNYTDAKVRFWYFEDITSASALAQGGLKLQWTDDEGDTWNDFADGDYNVALNASSLPMGGFGGATKRVIVELQTLTQIEVDLSVLDGRENVRIRFCTATSGAPVGSPYGPYISGIRYFANPNEILCIDWSMTHLRDGYGAQWSYARIPNNEQYEYGTFEKARRAAPAATHPTLGTGIVNNLVANPQVGNDIGGVPGGPNIGFPAGIGPLHGLNIELVGSDEIITATGTGTIRISFSENFPLLGSPYSIVLLMGEEATWVGGANPGGQIQLQGTAPAHMLCAVRQSVAYYDVPSGPGPWPAANTLGGIHNAMNPGDTLQYTFTLQGIWPVGTVLACHVFIINPFVGLVVGGTGYFTRLFHTDTIRSNALRFVIIP